MKPAALSRNPSYLVWLTPLLILLLCGASPDRPKRERENRFQVQGIQVGEKLPTLEVYTLEGKSQTLDDLTKGKPTLIVTASLTCPVARRRSSEIQNIQQKFGDHLNVFLLYILEAHPKGSPSPYSGREWVTRPNEREGILRAQPKSNAERLVLAREFQKRLGVSVPLVVDGMENKGWHALGGGPNVGVLLDASGVVKVKHGWFDGRTMEDSIEYLLDEANR